MWSENGERDAVFDFYLTTPDVTREDADTYNGLIRRGVIDRDAQKFNTEKARLALAMGYRLKLSIMIRSVQMYDYRRYARYYTRQSKEVYTLEDRVMGAAWRAVPSELSSLFHALSQRTLLARASFGMSSVALYCYTAVSIDFRYRVLNSGKTSLLGPSMNYFITYDEAFSFYKLECESEREKLLTRSRYLLPYEVEETSPRLSRRRAISNV